MAGVAVVVVAAGLWWAWQAPTVEPVATAAEPPAVGNAGAAIVPAPMDSPKPAEVNAAVVESLVKEPATVVATERDRPPERPKQTAIGTGTGKPVLRPPGAGNSAECGRIMQSMSLGDSNPRLRERFNQLGCR